MLKTPQITDGSGFYELYAWTASHFQNYWSLGLHQTLTHLDGLAQFTKDMTVFYPFLSLILLFQLNFRKLTGQRW